MGTGFYGSNVPTNSVTALKEQNKSAQIWSVCNNGIIQFYLPPTHEPNMHLLPSSKTSSSFGWYSLRLPRKGWPGWVDLDRWLHTEIDPVHRKMSPDTVTHPSTNRTRRRLTWLIQTNVLPLRQTATTVTECAEGVQCRIMQCFLWQTQKLSAMGLNPGISRTTIRYVINRTLPHNKHRRSQDFRCFEALTVKVRSGKKKCRYEAL